MIITASRRIEFTQAVLGDPAIKSAAYTECLRQALPLLTKGNSMSVQFVEDVHRVGEAQEENAFEYVVMCLIDEPAREWRGKDHFAALIATARTERLARQKQIADSLEPVRETQI